jgi:molybdate transport system substrate-binding protein
LRFSATGARLTALASILALCVSIGAGGAGATTARSAAQVSGLTIFAGSSMTTVLPQIDPNNTYSFGSTTTLGTQIANGAPADLLLGANTTETALLYSEGYVEQPVNYTRNTLAVVVPKSNPANIKSIYDLENPGVTIDEAASSVPVGSYTVTVLNQMGINAQVQANVVSQETDDANVVSKVALGQVDAGFVYLSDYVTDPSQLTLITVPAWAQPKITYALAIVKNSPNQSADQAFVSELLSPSGQSFFVKDGFLPLTAPVPTITVASPLKGAPGASVTVKGSNLEGTTSVTFAGGHPAKFKVVSNFKLTFVVPAKAKTSTFTITNPAGTATSKVFTIT